MPGDTVIFHSGSDSSRILDSIAQLYKGTTQSDENSLYNSGFIGMVLVFLSIVGVPFLINRWIEWYRKKQVIKAALNDLPAHAENYNSILSSYNSYYRSLSPAYRQRFLQRVVAFMETKKFEYINLEKEERMPLLISAASVQITFGLDKFLLDYFDTIHILQHDYQYVGYSHPFMGHVNHSGIYLSWDNFLKGFEDDTDANNVGIHEMAHALAFVNFMAENNDGIDHPFKYRFKIFSETARPIFEAMQNGTTNMLDNYAATNYNEFWAVLLENFFEKSRQLKAEIPELYQALILLLNQDPLLPDKVLPV